MLSCYHAYSKQVVLSYRWQCQAVVWCLVTTNHLLKGWHLSTSATRAPLRRVGALWWRLADLTVDNTSQHPGLALGNVQKNISHLLNIHVFHNILQTKAMLHLYQRLVVLWWDAMSWQPTFFYLLWRWKVA